ncbi:MAG TPA: hypothetical protein VKV80_03920 [Streptosporangiaceae bacterium]|nr:hypothetical protein [Streptosporangiaceae bacterium]
MNKIPDAIGERGQRHEIRRGATQRPPLAVVAALQALRDAFRDYRADLTRGRAGTWHFELIRQGDGPGPWCLISGSPRKIYDTLSGVTSELAVQETAADSQGA